MESFKFITPAQVKVLLVPLGGISPREFSHYTEIVQSATDIRLLDVSPIPECRYFNPQEFSQGRIFLSASADFPSEETSFLEDFEPFRKTFIVLGIGVHSPSVQKQKDALKTLKAQYSAAITHNIIYYKSICEENGQREIFHISEESEQVTTSIETVVCGITKNFLQALDAYASSYESITLRSPMSLTDSSVLTRTINQAQKRLSSGSSFKASFSNGQNITPLAKDSKLKSSQRQTGRQAKLMGNFFLLAGRTNDAFQYFTDAAINAKKTDDHLWLASALEGLSVSVMILSFLGLPHQIQNPMFATVLQLPKSKGLPLMKGASKASLESVVSRQSVSAATPRNSTSSSLSLGGAQPNSPTDVSQIQVIEFLLLLASRCSYYYKVSSADIDDCVPDIVFVESLLRNVKLMTTIFLSSTSDTGAIVETLVGLESPKKEGGCAEFHLSKKTIISEIDQIFALQLNQLEVTVQCRIYCALASIYNDLGLQRKHGLVLRLLLDVLIPKATTIEHHYTSGEVGPLKSIKNIIELLFSIYHIDRNTEISDVSASKHYNDWIVLQLSLIKVCLRIVEAFKDYDTLIKLCVLTLSRFTHCLPIEDQMRLKDKLSWLSVVSGSGVTDIEIPHPDPFLIRDSQFIVQSRSTNLFPFSVDEFSSAAKDGEQANSVFFDPYKKSSKTINMDRVICQNEVYQLKVVLQNPFYFGLEIHSLKVVAEDGFEIETLTSLLKVASVLPINQSQGMSVKGWKNVMKPKQTAADLKQVATSEGFVVPPNSIAEVIISFRPLTSGRLQIQGFNVTFGNYKPQFFYIVDNEKFCGIEKLTYSAVQKPSEEYQTLDNLFSNLSISESGNRIRKKMVSLIAIPSQPTLTNISKRTNNDWTMLIEGEVQSSSLQLRNCSKEVVNYLSISLWDSTIDSINSKLNLNAQQNSLNAAEVYELEWSLLEKKALCVTNKSDIASKYSLIKPGGEMTIDYDIIGKRGMVESKLILEYGKRSSEGQDENFLKRLVIPFNVSVHRSLEIISNDVIPIFPSFWQSSPGLNANSTVDRESLAPLLEFISCIEACSNEKVSDYCLLVLDVKNFWKDLLTAKIVNKMDSGKDFIIESRILPNKSSRMFIPIRRIGGDLFNPLKGIPSLRNKQFIKNYSITEDEEHQMKKSFWSKYEILKNLKGMWCTTDGFTERSGEIDLRRIRINAAMADTLVYDSISIFHNILAEGDNQSEVKIHNNKHILEREKFYILKTRIINHTKHSISGILRHVPFPLCASSKQDLSIDQKILYNGVLQIHVGGDSIGPGATYERELGFMLLEKGQYEWGCVFDTSSDQGKRTIGREPIYIIAS